jgi:hypothetical protein
LGHLSGVSNDPQCPAYAYRPRPLGGEVAFRLEPGHLFIDTGRKQERIAYGQIESVRLTYHPSNASLRAFRTVLWLRDGRSVKIGNISWRTHFEAERQDAPYTAFVTALLARAQAANPALVARAGQNGILWGITALAGIAMVCGLVAVAAIQAWNGAWTMLGLAALFLLPMAWQVWAIASRNRPRPFRPPDVPTQVLP